MKTRIDSLNSKNALRNILTLKKGGKQRIHYKIFYHTIMKECSNVLRSDEG